MEKQNLLVVKVQHQLLLIKKNLNIIFSLGILSSTSHFRYIDAKWPFIEKNNIHEQREDLDWKSIQHSLVSEQHMNKQDILVINSIVDDECIFGQNVCIHNSIVGNRVTLGNNCSIHSVDFSKEVNLRFRIPKSYCSNDLNSLSAELSPNYSIERYYSADNSFTSNY